MPNWEDMKDYSFVSLKLTKAKSFCEGIERCLVQKHKQNNPVYNHIKQKANSETSLSKTQAKRQTSPFRAAQTNINLDYQLSYSIPFKPTIHACFAAKRQVTQPIKSQRYVGSATIRQKKEKQQNSNDSFEGKKFLSNKVSHFKTIMKRFAHSLDLEKRRYGIVIQAKKQLHRVNIESEERIQTLALTGDIVERMKIQEDAKGMRAKQKKRSQQVRQLQKPVHFPLTNKQIRTIVAQSRLKLQNQGLRAKKMIQSIYNYKSSKLKKQHKEQIIRDYN